MRVFLFENCLKPWHFFDIPNHWSEALFDLICISIVTAAVEMPIDQWPPSLFECVNQFDGVAHSHTRPRPIFIRGNVR